MSELVGRGGCKDKFEYFVASYRRGKEDLRADLGAEQRGCVLNIARGERVWGWGWGRCVGGCFLHLTTWEASGSSYVSHCYHLKGERQADAF